MQLFTVAEVIFTGLTVGLVYWLFNGLTYQQPRAREHGLGTEPGTPPAAALRSAAGGQPNPTVVGVPAAQATTC